MTLCQVYHYQKRKNEVVPHNTSSSLGTLLTHQNQKGPGRATETGLQLPGKVIPISKHPLELGCF